MNIEKPTIDCDTCNQRGVDKNNKFLCIWNPEHKLVFETSESGDKIIRCFYVMESNAIYKNAIKVRGKGIKNESNISN